MNSRLPKVRVISLRTCQRPVFFSSLQFGKLLGLLNAIKTHPFSAYRYNHPHPPSVEPSLDLSFFLTMTYNVTPIPDVDDDQKLQQYIQDRRVIGVCLRPFI